jgi:SAM-dependent methyltransferase
MFQTLRPYIRGRVLEIGSGIGNMSSLLLKMDGPVVVSDQSLPYLEMLRTRLGADDKLEDVLHLDLEDPDFDTKFAPLMGSFDTVIALNVIEHVRQDDLALQNCKKMLKKGGHFIMLVPAYPSLYNRFDKELGHFRRYTRAGLSELVAKYFELKICRHFNLAGIAGWWMSGAVLKNKIIPSSQMRLFNTLVPVFKVADRLVSGKAGLSVWAVGINNKSEAECIIPGFSGH